MNHWFYISSPYLLPLLGYLFGVLVVLAIAAVQYLGASCLEENFREIHIKFARVLLGKFVSVRKDGAVILHDFAFRRGFGYIFLSELILAGTIFLFTVANMVYFSTETCNIVNKDMVACYNGNQSEHPIMIQKSCSQQLEAGTASELVCYRIVLDFGIGLAVLGGLLFLLPFIHSCVTEFIVNFSGQEQQMQYFTGVFQVVVIFLLLVCVAGSFVALEMNSSHRSRRPRVFIEVVFFLFFLMA